mgnify:CR=1 FL=1
MYVGFKEATMTSNGDGTFKVVGSCKLRDDGIETPCEMTILRCLVKKQKDGAIKAFIRVGDMDNNISINSVVNK